MVNAKPNFLRVQNYFHKLIEGTNFMELLYQSRMTMLMDGWMTDERGAVGEMRIGMGNNSTRKKKLSQCHFVHTFYVT
jgi:hypothetical protein